MMKRQEIIEEIKARLNANDEKINKHEITPVQWSKNIRECYYDMMKKSGCASGMFDMIWHAATRAYAIEKKIYITTQFLMP